MSYLSKREVRQSAKRLYLKRGNFILREGEDGRLLIGKYPGGNLLDMMLSLGSLLSEAISGKASPAFFSVLSSSIDDIEKDIDHLKEFGPKGIFVPIHIQHLEYKIEKLREHSQHPSK